MFSTAPESRMGTFRDTSQLDLMFPPVGAYDPVTSFEAAERIQSLTAIYQPTSRAGLRVDALYRSLTAEDFERMERSAARIEATGSEAKVLAEGKHRICLRRSCGA